MSAARILNDRHGNICAECGRIFTGAAFLWRGLVYDSVGCLKAAQERILPGEWRARGAARRR